MTISRVTPESLPEVWRQVRDQILVALDKGAGQHYTETHYYEQVASGAMQMIAAHEGEQVIACGILSVQENPNSKVLFVELLAGRNLDYWLPEVESVLKQYQAQVGASTIEALCRPGLTKKLTNWTPVATLMRL